MTQKAVIRWSAGAGALVLLGALLGCTVAAQMSAEVPAAKLQQTFVEAGKAYDEGRLGDAIALYQKLIDQGYVSKELFFNLGNAYFRSGKTGRAVLNYRRAWVFAPRDPDILANLRFALQNTGAAAPAFSLASRLLLKLGRAEWLAVAVAGYWSTFIALGLFVLFRGWRPALLRVIVPLALLTAVALGGLGLWSSLRRMPEQVVLEPGQKALFAPLAGSTEHFALPEGSIVRGLETSESWIKVASGKQAGWLRRTACEPVYPWH